MSSTHCVGRLRTNFVTSGPLLPVRNLARSQVTSYNTLAMSTHFLSSDTGSPYVERKPTVRGGRPVIRGTRFLVSDVIWHYKRGLSVEEILLHFPHLTAAGIYGALAYYHEHQAEIEAEIREDADEAAWMRRYPPSSPPLHDRRKNLS